MAYFYSLRGWLEVEPDNFPQVIEAIKRQRTTALSDSKLRLYAQGWCWNDNPINWTRYLFYGADVTEEGLEYFRELLEMITNRGLNLSGYFHAQGEDGEENMVYKVTDDFLYIEEDVSKVEIT